MLKLMTSLALALATLQVSTIGQSQSLQNGGQKPTATPAAVAPGGAKPSAAPAATQQGNPTPPTAAAASSSASGSAAAAPVPVSPSAEPSAPANAAPASASPNSEAPSNAPRLVYLQRSPLPVVVTETPPSDIKEQPKNYEYRFTVTVDFANVLWRTNRGYDLFSNKDASVRLGVGAGYDLLKLPNQLTVAVEVGGLVEPVQSSDKGLLGNTLKAELSGVTALVGGSLRWNPVSWMAPYGRLQLLASRYSLDISTVNSGDVTSGSAAGSDWSYQRWAMGGALGAGVLFNLPPHSPVNVGLLLEGGYWLQKSVDLELDNGGTPSGNITTYGARLGSLGNSGPYFRAAGVIRF